MIVIVRAVCVRVCQPHQSDGAQTMRGDGGQFLGNKARDRGVARDLQGVDVPKKGSIRIAKNVAFGWSLKRMVATRGSDAAQGGRIASSLGRLTEVGEAAGG